MKAYEPEDNNAIIIYKTIMNDDRAPRLVIESKHIYGDTLIQSATDVATIFTQIFKLDKQTEEYVYMSCMDATNRVKAVFEISHGTVIGSICRTREVFQKALMCGAVKIIIVHNHPSGDLKQSQQDIDITIQLCEAGEIMDIKVVDHIIIGASGHASLLELGYIK
jgi:DNA repair protein RadC